MATYLITGGAGFIGSHLAERLLARGDRLCVLDNLSTGQISNLHPGTDLVQGDITDAAAVAGVLRGVAGVFHLAAIASVQAYTTDWAQSSRINGLGSSVVFEAVARAGLPLVYASSAAVYGNPVYLPLSEAAALQPISGYGADKLGNEMQAAAMAEVLGLTSVGLRFFNVYGPRQRPDSAYSGVITVFLEHWRNNRQLTVFGDGSQTRDFVFVQDAAQALVAAMDRAQSGASNGAGEVFNICSGRATSIRDLIAALSQAVCTPLEVEFIAARNGEIQASLGDPSAATRDLGFCAHTDLVTGLAETLAWTKTHRLHPIPETKNATPPLARQENRL